MLINKTINYSIQYDKLHDTKNSSILLPSITLKIEENYKKNLYLIHRVLKAQLSQHRQGNANTKTRDEVRGGGKKPWKQKGTGRARAGSNRSPLWRGGGVIFGPQAHRTYKSKINKKEKNKAIINILYNKASHTIIINENFDLLEKPNTKNIINKLSNLNINIKRKILIIVDIKNQILYKSINNIPNIDIIQADHLNTLILLKTDLILLTPNGFNQLKNIYNDNT